MHDRMMKEGKREEARAFRSLRPQGSEISLPRVDAEQN